ncbi:MAG: glutamate--tRNA ligase family protein, partial [Gemmatimonadetes bacterium]|nr:glutamate--tRNA ligase family protein [Gemmatimonadota bacterium]
EFQDNRELYDWFIEHTRPGAAGIDEIPGAEGSGGEALGSWEPRPRQYEFARRNLDFTVVSKRKLLSLVSDGHVDGWDDPRMPTLAGLRRRGIPPDAIRAFCEQVGIGKAENRVEVGTFEWAVRETLNARAPRVLCVVNPLKVVLTNYPDDAVDWLEAPYFPHDVEDPPAAWPATRRIPFSANVYIEREDFAEEPPSGFKRLAPGREVRLRHGPFVTCQEIVKNESGEIVELRCTYDPDTLHGSAPDGRRPRGTIHWVSADAGVEAEVRLYDLLFAVPDPTEGVHDFRENLNPDSLDIRQAVIEPSVTEDPVDVAYQFERLGYFVRDRPSKSVANVRSATPTVGDPAAARSGAMDDPDGATRLVFNRTVPLRDSWIKHGAARATGTATASASGAVEHRGSTQATATSVATASAVVVGADSGRERRDQARETSPTLRAAYDRFRGELGLSEDVADLLSGAEETVTFYERAISGGATETAVANWLLNKVRGAEANGHESKLEPEALGALVELVESGRISGATGNELLERLVSSGGDPVEIVDREGLGRLVDWGRIREITERVLTEHPDEVGRYRGGQVGLAGFFVGQVMRATENRADPALVRQIVEESLA